MSHIPLRQTLSACWLLLLGLHAVDASSQTIEAVTEESSYSYMQDGRVGGAAGHIVEAVLQRAGLTDYRMGIYPWARAYDQALREPDVLIYPILRTEDRESLFKWVGEIDGTLAIFYKLRGAPRMPIAVLGDAKAYRIGVLRDDYREKYLQAQGFTRLVVSANNLENFNRLLNGQVQLVPMPERDARKLCADAHLAFDTLERVYSTDAMINKIYMAFSQATSDDVVHRAQNAFMELKSAGVIQRLLQEQP